MLQSNRGSKEGHRGHVPPTPRKITQDRDTLIDKFSNRTNTSHRTNENCESSMIAEYENYNIIPCMGTLILPRIFCKRDDAHGLVYTIH